jgi:hypothetical protein
MNGEKFEGIGYYPDAVEDVPTNLPKPRGKTMQMTIFVDADQAGDVVTCRSQNGVLVYLNCAPILWYSKKQNSVETFTFGSNFINLISGIEKIKGLRYKHRTLGIPLNGHTHEICQ